MLLQLSNYRVGKSYKFRFTDNIVRDCIVMAKPNGKLTLKTGDAISTYDKSELSPATKAHYEIKTEKPTETKIETKVVPEIPKPVKVEKAEEPKLISNTIHLGDLLKSEQEVDHKYAYLSLRHDVRVLLDKHGFKTNAHMKISEILTILDKALTI